MKNRSFWKQSGLVLFCILLFFLPVFIKNNGILIYYGDSFEEFYQFFLGGWEKVHALDFSQFDWSIGLGGNWFAYSDVYLFSPYFWMTVPFPKEWLPYEMTILNILKLLLTFQFTYLWISKISKNELTRFVCGAMVAFSGWVFFYNHYTNFLDAYVMFPLLLYFAECYLQDGKFKGFVLSMFFLTIQTYYFAYMFMPFGCLYGLFRYLMLYKKIEPKHMLLTALKYFGWLMLGIGMACCILLPTAYTLFGNPRLEETYGLLDTISKFDAFKIVTSLFVPVFSRLNPNYFISTDKLGNLGWGYGCSVFSLILFPVLFTQLFSLLRKRTVRIVLYFYGVLGLFVIFPISWLVLQGTIDTRWFYMIVMLNAFSSAIVLDAYQERVIDSKLVMISVILVCFCVAALFGISYFKYLNDYDMLRQLFSVLLVEFVILLIYFFSFWKQKNTFIILGVAAEIVLSGLVHMYYNPPREYTLFDPEIESGCLARELENRDSDFYRIIYDNENYVTSNEPFAKNYAGISFYYSIYNFEQEEYLNRYKSTWSMPMVDGRTIALNQLAAKYWYSRYYTHRVPYGYVPYDQICGYDVFVNETPIPLAMFMNETVNTEELLKLNYFEQDLIMMNAIALEDSHEMPRIEIPFEKVGTFSTSEPIEIQLDPEKTNATVYLIPQDYNPEVQLGYYYNDELKISHYFYQLGYVDQYLNNEYYNKIIADYSVNRYSTVDVYIENHDDHWYENWYTEKKKDFITDIQVNHDTVKMSFVSDKSQYVLTSIPYDEGWKCYVDGINVEYKKANMGFIAFEIAKGQHEVLFRYKAPWFNVGLLISGVCTSLFVFLIWKDKKKKMFFKEHV